MQRAGSSVLVSRLRAVRVGAVLAVIAAVILGGVWAADSALSPVNDPLNEDVGPVTYTVQVGEVSRSLNFNAVGSWKRDLVGYQHGNGTVTSVNLVPGEEVSAGRIIYSLDLRPVVVAEGDVPMFRDLGFGDSGDDVAQIQALLERLGYYDGAIDADFGATTGAAVKQWQQTLGLKQTGVVLKSDVLFAPSLPARMSLAEGMVVGATVGDGQASLYAIADVPDFRISLDAGTANSVPVGSEVRIRYADGEWSAKVAMVADFMAETGVNDRADLILSSTGSDPICERVCTKFVDLGSSSTFSARIIVVPSVSGPLVPGGAIVTDAANNAFLVLTDGSQIPVSIVASARGLAIVNGVEVGEEIVLPIEAR